MSQEEVFINGDVLRLRRESRGWALGDLATRACMSVKQIRQLEEGGMSSFYSVAVKVTAAKKVAALLDVATEEIFAQHPAPVDASVDHASEEAISEVPVPLVENVDVVEQSIAVESHQDAEVAPESEKSKTSLWVIAGLFAAALAVAAYLQPKDEPVAEPAPPLQVVPPEPTDAASAAESSASAASGDVMASSSVQKPASVASALVAVPRITSTPASVATPAVMPTASVASKPQ
jgi:transcriptional regulator with XRE-family HTH domain